jgi:hypothetical protein
MLDLMNPQWAGRWPRRLRRQARFDEAGGTAHDHPPEDRAMTSRFNRASEGHLVAASTASKEVIFIAVA